MKSLVIIVSLLFCLLLLLLLQKFRHIFSFSLFDITVKPMEGFIAFEQAKNNMTIVTIPQYDSSKEITKLCDNLFFDTKINTILEIDGNPYSLFGNVGNVSSSSTSDSDTINSIYSVNPNNGTSSIIYTRGSNNTTTPTATHLDTTSILPWTYTTVGKNTDTYQVFYVPTGNVTMQLPFIYIIDTTTQQSILTISSEFGKIDDFIFTTNSALPTANRQVIPNNSSPSNGTMVSYSYYDPTITVYQIDTAVFYDYISKNVIVQSNSGGTISAKIYDIYGNAQSSTSVVTTSGTYAKQQSDKNSVMSYSPFVVGTSDSRIVICSHFGQNTVILVIQPASPTSTTYVIENAIVFTNSGATIVNGNIPPTITPTQTQTTTSSTSITSQPATVTDTSFAEIPSANQLSLANTQSISDYYKWFWFMQSIQPVNTLGNQQIGIGTPMFSQDYMLKTNINATSCSANGGVTCSNCWNCNTSGNKCSTCGSSTTTQSIPSMNTMVNGSYVIPVSSNNDNGNVVLQPNWNNDNNTYSKNPVANVVDNVVGDTASVLGTAITGTALVAGTAINGASNVLSSIGNGISTATTGTNYSNTNIPTNSNTATNSNIPTNSNNNETYYQQKNNQRNQVYSTTGTTPTPSNRFGQLSSQSNTFLPMTADFSKFSK